MTSPLPPRLRDTRSIVDRLRQDRQNLRQLGVGFVGGRFPPARPLGANVAVGEFEDEEDLDENTDQIAFENGDSVTATGPGTVTLALTYTPIEGSLHVRWNGLDQPPTEWTVSGQTVTIPDPGSHVLAGDVFTAAYAHYSSDSANEEGTPAGVAFGASGWSWLQVEATDAADYSATSFDDSGWAVDDAPFGEDYGGAFPPPATVWTQGTRIWMRRSIAATAGLSLTCRIRADVDVVVWLNGVEVHSSSPDGAEVEFTIDGANVAATNVLAVRVTGDGLSGDYADAEVVQ